MNIKITSKDGITLKTQGKYCTEDIHINVGDEVGGGATISTEKWSGVSVINTGYLENVYFNTALNVEEVAKILNRLDYSNEESNEYEFYGVFKTLTANVLYLKIIKNGNDYLIKLYDDSGSIQEIIFSTNLENGFIGWSDVVLNDNCCIVDNNVGYFIEGYKYGSQNNIISSLISGEPFTQIENEVVTLEGDYDGSTLVVDELPKGGWQGTIVPNTGYVEKVYLNTNLSVEEVVNLIDSIESPMVMGSTKQYYFLMSSDASFAIGIYKSTGDEGYLNILLLNGDNQNILFSDREGDTGTIGWQPEVIANNVITSPSGVELVSELQGYPIGAENDKLVSLISTTPFTQSKPNTIDIKSMIEQKKIPLEIKVENVYKWVTLEGTPIDGGFDFGILPSDLYEKNKEEWDYTDVIGYFEWSLQGMGILKTNANYVSYWYDSVTNGKISTSVNFILDLRDVASGLGLLDYMEISITLCDRPITDGTPVFRIRGTNTYDMNNGLANWTDYPNSVVNQFVSITNYFKFHILVKA